MTPVPASNLEPGIETLQPETSPATQAPATDGLEEDELEDDLLNAFDDAPSRLDSPEPPAGTREISNSILTASPAPRSTNDSSASTLAAADSTSETCASSASAPTKRRLSDHDDDGSTPVESRSRPRKARKTSMEGAADVSKAVSNRKVKGRAAPGMLPVNPTSNSAMHPLSQCGIDKLWAVPIYNWFSQLDSLDSAWSRVVNGWLALEDADEFSGGRRLPGKDRPKAIATWIQYGRPAGYDPGDVGNLEVYKEKFWTWWILLQPTFRREHQESEGSATFLKQVSPPPTSKSAWKSLDITGVNGLTTALGGLCLWGLAVAKMPSGDFREREARENSKGRWLRAVSDVAFATEGVLASRS
jgi:hypothetical protein